LVAILLLLDAGEDLLELERLVVEWFRESERGAREQVVREVAPPLRRLGLRAQRVERGEELRGADHDLGARGDVERLPITVPIQGLDLLGEPFWIRGIVP